MVRIEKNASVWTIIHSRFEEARNAMDPDSADALVAAFEEFDQDDSASVADASGRVQTGDRGGGRSGSGWRF